VKTANESRECGIGRRQRTYYAAENIGREGKGKIRNRHVRKRRGRQTDKGVELISFPKKASLTSVVAIKRGENYQPEGISRSSKMRDHVRRRTARLACGQEKGIFKKLRGAGTHAAMRWGGVEVLRGNRMRNPRQTRLTGSLVLSPSCRRRNGAFLALG